MRKVRIVLDTNVFLVSLAPTFRLHWIFKSLIQGKFELCVSNEILMEYQEVISQRYGFKRTAAQLDFVLLLPNVIQVNPQFKWDLLIDSDDNKFIDCYVSGNADILVTNDRGYKTVKGLEFPPITILSANEFEQQFKEHFS